MKFLASRELGRLARWLRILGYDTIYFRENNNSTLIITALRDDRIVVTRNNRLVKDRALRSISVEGDTIERQLAQIIRECELTIKSEDMFTRCILCNEPLCPIVKQAVESRVPAYVFKTHNTFFQCRQCQCIYWQGSHWGNVKEIMQTVAN